MSDGCTELGQFGLLYRKKRRVTFLQVGLLCRQKRLVTFIEIRNKLLISRFYGLFDFVEFGVVVGRLDGKLIGSGCIDVGSSFEHDGGEGGGEGGTHGANVIP